MKLSVLDQSPIAEGSNGGLALRHSIELAKLVDKLGYHRFWMAEHHATPALACASPEIMLALLGQQTKHIRLGTGGIMLPHYSPFKVAESFSMLEALYPGRIDLGLGRAPGSDPLTAFALQQDRRQRAGLIFPEQIAELLGYFDDDLIKDHPFRHLARTMIAGRQSPAVWVLGSSSDSARLAASMGLPYCIADFIAGEVPELAEQYRQEFRPSTRLEAPKVMVCCWLYAADSEEKAERVAASARMMFAKLSRGELIAVPTPETAMDWLARNPVTTPVARRPVVGTAKHCTSALRHKSDVYDADEIMLVNICHDHADRLESYRLMAKALHS